MRAARPAAVAVLAAACTMHTAYMEARFPVGGGPWIAPMLDPLVASHVELEMTFESADGRSTYVTEAILDTGAWRSMTSRAVPKQIGVETTTTSRIKIIDVGGATRPWTGAVIPRVRVGNLHMEDFPIAVDDNAPTLLGNEILSRQPIEIDRDRGLVIFGAAPWKDGTIVHLEPGAERSSPRVDATISGEQILLTLDTGAFATSIDVETGDDLGLVRKPLLESERYTGVHSGVNTNFRYLITELRLGAAVLEGVDATPIPRMQQGGGFNRKVVGLLGQDILARYRLRIDNEEMRLVPRGGIVAGTAERLARWSWMPSCPERPGCIEATLRVRPASGGEAAVVEVTYRAQRAYGAAARVLFGFSDAAGELMTELPLLEVRLADVPSDEPRTSGLVAQGQHGAVLWPLLRASPQPTALVLLDANPARGGSANDIAAVTPLGGWKRPETNIRIKRDARFAGPDYLVFNGSLERCIAACDVDPRCAAFSYNPRLEHAPATCALKKSLGRPEAAESYVAGVKP